MTDKNSTDLRPAPDGAIKLPSGGWALLSDPDDATGRDIATMRKAMNEEGVGDFTTALTAYAICVRLVDWELPGLPNLQTRFPHDQAKSITGMLRARDLKALERLILPWAKEMIGVTKADEAKQGEGEPPAAA